jgi:hypothetical protein
MAGSGSAIARWLIGLFALLVAVMVLSSVYGYVRPRMAARTHGAEARVIRVQVLNGSEEGGIGSRVASFLREGGFHVVEIGNADRSDYFATMVVARGDDVSPARAVARYLGGPPIVRQAWSTDVAEVTVVVGSDRSRLRLSD